MKRFPSPEPGLYVDEVRITKGTERYKSDSGRFLNAAVLIVGTFALAVFLILVL